MFFIRNYLTNFCSPQEIDSNENKKRSSAVTTENGTLLCRSIFFFTNKMKNCVHLNVPTEFIFELGREFTKDPKR